MPGLKEGTDQCGKSFSATVMCSILMCYVRNDHCLSGGGGVVKNKKNLLF